MTGYRHLLYVLALTEASLAILAALGAMLAMGGSVIYLLAGLAVAAVYIVAGRSGRRWALITLIAMESLRLVAFGLSGLLGALPWVQLSLTVATLADSVILPMSVIAVAAWLLTGVSRRSAPDPTVPINPTEPTTVLA